MRNALIVLALIAPLEAQAGTVVDVGAGLMGAAGGNFISKPSDVTLQTPAGTGETSLYPGFGGFTPGGGLMLDARVFGLVGLEVDVLYMSNRGTGDITLGPTSLKLDIGQTAVHVPILLKAAIPVGVVRPYAVFGPELVFPSDPSLTITPQLAPGSTLFGAKADKYTMLCVGLGLEIKLPIPAIDLRIPISLRFSWNPGTSDKVSERADFQLNGATITGVTFKSEWQYQALLTAGAAIYF